MRGACAPYWVQRVTPQCGLHLSPSSGQKPTQPDSIADLLHAHVLTGNTLLRMILCGAMQMHWVTGDGAVVERVAEFTQAMLKTAVKAVELRGALHVGGARGSTLLVRDGHDERRCALGERARREQGASRNDGKCLDKVVHFVFSDFVRGMRNQFHSSQRARSIR